MIGFLNGLHMLSVIERIAYAWDHISAATIRKSWNKIIPDPAPSFSLETDLATWWQTDNLAYLPQRMFFELRTGIDSIENKMIQYNVKIHNGTKNMKLDFSNQEIIRIAT